MTPVKGEEQEEKPRQVYVGVNSSNREPKPKPVKKLTYKPVNYLNLGKQLEKGPEIASVCCWR